MCCWGTTFSSDNSCSIWVYLCCMYIVWYLYCRFQPCWKWLIVPVVWWIKGSCSQIQWKKETILDPGTISQQNPTSRMRRLFHRRRCMSTNSDQWLRNYSGIRAAYRYCVKLLYLEQLLKQNPIIGCTA